MEPSYNYKLAQLNEISKINSFNNISEGEWINDFFSPEKNKSFLYICNYGDQVIGTEGYVDYLMYYRGVEVVTHRSERTLVSTAHRGKRIFNKLVEKCDRHAKEYSSIMCWGSTTAIKAFTNVGFEKYIGFRNHYYYCLQKGRKSFSNCSLS